MNFIIALALFGSVLVLSLIATKWLIGFLTKKAILDHPNERSSHVIATPRGGGLVLVFLAVPLILIFNLISPQPLDGYWIVSLSAAGLALISWLDDLKDLGPASRFLVQILCVALCLVLMPHPENGYSSGFLPSFLEKILLFFAWIWFINLFNFMDGIDGISGVEISSLSVGLIALTLLAGLNITIALCALILLAVSLGFLRWNWHKAKIFMGDVGSIPLGFLLGWLLITIAGDGLLVAAVLLPLYYLFDATWTLIKRGLQRKKIWQAHREHFYQHAHKSGLNHDQIVLRILILNICLVGLAIASTLWINPALAFLLGLGLTGLLCYSFAKRQIEP